MSLSNISTPELLKQIGKDPRSYVIFIFAGLMWYFVFKWTGTTGEMNNNCKAENAELRKELAIERQMNYDYLRHDRDRSDSIRMALARQLDSLLHERLEDKTKTNLRNNP